MKEVFVEGNITNKNEKTLLDGNGILNEEFLSWTDKTQVNYLLDLKNNKLIKEDSNTKLELTFIKDKETKGLVFLKAYNKILQITILTTSYQNKNNSYKISYKITEESSGDNIIDLFLTWK